MRLITKTLFLHLSLLTLLILGGCNGSADGTDPGGGEGEENYTLSLSYKTVVEGQCDEPTDNISFAQGASICVAATLKNNNSNQSGALISFSTTLGELSPTTKLTDSSGVAEVILGDSTASIGAGTVTASFTPSNTDITTLTATKNFEFINSGTAPEQQPKFSAGVVNNGVAVTQFKIGETVQLQALFVDAESIGIANQQVTFSAGNATLSPSSTLTNAQGLAQVSYTPQDSELGAASLNATLDYDGTNYQSNSLYEVLPSDAIGDDGEIKIGHFDSNNQFIDGELGTTLTDTNGQYVISAGGSFGVFADIISQAQDGSITRLQTPTSVSFTSDCVASNNASIDTPVTSLSGTANSTFQDTSCSGNSERDDIIVATTQVGNQTLSASLAFTLSRQTLASLSFISAEPTNIRIKGAGGTGSSESSLVTFMVTSANGQPAAQQQVNFELDTVVGGLSFSNGEPSASGLTNSAGLASIRVLAGTVPTPVRVVASATDADTGDTITSQSEQLTVNTGLPQQLGFSLSSSILNPEADSYNGETATLTAYASDSFGNPAPDDTTINFTAEGGQIVSSCLTVNGRCSVEWTSADPRVPDHRITVLAYALGHETFFDTNGNNIFDDADGAAVDACLDNNGSAIACSGNGMDIETYREGGFSDLPDAFRDDDETGLYTDGEKFFNTAGNTEYQTQDGLFNGPQCEGSLCGTGQANKTYIRKALVMTMSGSHANFIVWQDSTKIIDTTDGTNNPATAIAPGTSSNFTVQFFDSAGQIMPADSSLSVTASTGTLIFTPFTVPNATRAGGNTTGFTVVNDIDPGSSGEPSKTSTVGIEVVTPKGNQSQTGFNVTLTGT
ncbi:Ig-like domain-containing protein [Shewanella waksmanii]|uniref:Ig-like domain-containing protein n=1 Tax=Shewanella waksmanii TaxID=213783 RepID=UPI0004B46D69|nr:Ig-like domain-containing protein [Shewanella waksmanii]